MIEYLSNLAHRRVSLKAIINLSIQVCTANQELTEYSWSLKGIGLDSRTCTKGDLYQESSASGDHFIFSNVVFIEMLHGI